MYCDLPHEEGIRLLRRQIAGDPSDRPAVDLGEGAGAGEVRALQQVAVEGVVVQRRDAADQGPDACAIRLARRSVVDGGAALGAGRIDGSIQLHGRSLQRSEEHTSELQSLMRISYAVFCLKKKKK